MRTLERVLFLEEERDTFLFDRGDFARVNTKSFLFPFFNVLSTVIVQIACSLSSRGSIICLVMVYVIRLIIRLLIWPEVDHPYKFDRFCNISLLFLKKKKINTYIYLFFIRTAY